ncbi:MAG TPA: hypothetical protein VGE39_13945 [Prosthecobacter sp.]
MKLTCTCLLLLAAALIPACETAPDGPPKTPKENTLEARNTGKVPDSVRDPRPEMPPTGPMFQPMR